jgi:hypothetical protein
MVIDKAMAGRFISEYKKFLLAIYRPEPDSPEPQRVIEKLAAARTRFVSNRGCWTNICAIWRTEPNRSTGR